MLTQEQAHQLVTNNAQVVGSDGKIGKVSQLFLDDQTGEPAWVTVKTGMFGGAETFVPIDQGTLSDDDLTVPYDQERVKNAPRIEDSDGHLERAEEADLYRHYGLQEADSPATGREDASDTAPRDKAQQRKATAGDASLTRSEEQLNVGTETHSAGKARLRKYVVTENVTKTVPVSREEVRLEREPIQDGDRARQERGAGTEIGEDDIEVELSEERVKVDKETVPVERVRMDTETVTEDQQVTEQVRKEHIDTDSAPNTKAKPKR